MVRLPVVGKAAESYGGASSGASRGCGVSARLQPPDRRVVTLEAEPSRTGRGEPETSGQHAHYEVGGTGEHGVRLGGRAWTGQGSAAYGLDDHRLVAAPNLDGDRPTVRLAVGEIEPDRQCKPVAPVRVAGAQRAHQGPGPAAKRLQHRLQRFAPRGEAEQGRRDRWGGLLPLHDAGLLELAE